MDARAALYPKRYGAWGGFPEGHAPDYTRCCEEVHGRERWSHGDQCTRPAGHGPHGAYCKQHDPEVAKARREKADADYKRKRYSKMKLAYGRTFYEALRQIAEGHNDPRTLAKGIVDKFEADFAPPA